MQEKESIKNKVETMFKLERYSTWGLNYMITCNEKGSCRMISLTNLGILTNNMIDGIIDIHFLSPTFHNTIILDLNKETYDKINALQSLDHLFSDNLKEV